MSRPTDRLVAQVDGDTGTVVLSCATTVPRVPRHMTLAHLRVCLIGEGMHTVPEILAAGASTVLVDPACPHDATALASCIERWQAWCGPERVGVWQPEGHLWRAATPLDLTSRAEARRAAFGVLTRREPEEEDLGRSDEARLRTALRELGIHQENGSDQLERAPASRTQETRTQATRTQADEGISAAARLEVSDACTACGVCIRSCPNDALSFALEGDTTGLMHDPGRCEGEQSCVSLCPVNAITTDGSWPLERSVEAESVSLIEMRSVECTRCGQRHRGEGSLCESCSYVAHRGLGAAMSVEEVLALGRPHRY